MKWETILQKCIYDLNTSTNQTNFIINHSGKLSLITLATLLEGTYKRTSYQRLSWSLIKELQEQMITRIEAWDIRNWRQLKAVFPKCFPKKDFTYFDLTEEGWVVE